MSHETFKLLFQDGPRAGETIPLGDSRTTLGRSLDNTIVLDEASISRHHLVFYVEDDGVSVEDVGSSAGTLINGVKLTGRKPLSHADLLEAGVHHIQVTCLSETLNIENRMEIFGSPDEIEEKFNSESEVNLNRVIKKTPAVPTHLDSLDEITGVFDFSDMPSEPAGGAGSAGANLNVNDGTVPLAQPEQKSQMPIILLLCGVIALLVIVLLYAIFIHGPGKDQVGEMQGGNGSTVVVNPAE